MDCYVFFTFLLGINSFYHITGVHSWPKATTTFSIAEKTVPNLPNTTGITVKIDPSERWNLIEMRCTFSRRVNLDNFRYITFFKGRNPATAIYRWSFREMIINDPFKRPKRITRIPRNFRFSYNRINVNILLTDEDEYRCQVNMGRFGNFTSPYVKVNVIAGPKRAVLFSANPGPHILGANLTLRCSANLGKPKGRLYWYRMWTPVTNEETVYEEANADGTFTVSEEVVVHNLSYSDNGVWYKCVPINAVGKHWSEKYTLDVRYLVRSIEVSNTQQPHYLGHSFTCKADGNPAPSYKWTKLYGTQDLLTSGATLTIPENAWAETLRYECSASNFVGSDWTRISYVLDVNITAVLPSTTIASTTTSIPTPTNSSWTYEQYEGKSPNEGKPSIAGVIFGIIGAVVVLLLVLCVLILLSRRLGILPFSKPKNERPGTEPGNQAPRRTSTPQGTAKSSRDVGQGYTNDAFGVYM